MWPRRSCRAVNGACIEQALECEAKQSDEGARYSLVSPGLKREFETAPQNPTALISRTNFGDENLQNDFGLVNQNFHRCGVQRCKTLVPSNS